MRTCVLSLFDNRIGKPAPHDAAVPFIRFYGGKMQKDVLGAA
jgi:hypothetical protein